MPAALSAATGQVAFPTLNLESFKGQFNITCLMDKVALPVLDPQIQSKAFGGKGGLQQPKQSLQESLVVTEQAVEQFARSATNPRQDRSLTSPLVAIHSTVCNL